MLKLRKRVREGEMDRGREAGRERKSKESQGGKEAVCRWWSGQTLTAKEAGAFRSVMMGREEEFVPLLKPHVVQREKNEKNAERGNWKKRIWRKERNRIHVQTIVGEFVAVEIEGRNAESPDWGASSPVKLLNLLSACLFNLFFQSWKIYFFHHWSHKNIHFVISQLFIRVVGISYFIVSHYSPCFTQSRLKQLCFHWAFVWYFSSLLIFHLGV